MGEQGRPWSSNWGPWSRKVWELFFCGSQSTYYINKHQIFQRCKSSNNLPQHFYAFSFFQEFSLQKLNSLSVFLTLNKICYSPVDILYVSVVCAVSPPVQCSHVMFVLWYLSPKGGSDGEKLWLQREDLYLHHGGYIFPCVHLLVGLLVD